MRGKVSKELRKVFAYNKPDVHAGYDIKFSGQRVKEIYVMDKDEDGNSIVKVRQEPVNMSTNYCKDRDRRFYKQIKKLYNEAQDKSAAEIKTMLNDLYSSEGI